MRGRSTAERDALNVLMLVWDAVGSTPTWATAKKTCPRGAAWSARLPVTQEVVGSNPIGDAYYGTVRKPAKRRSSNLRDRLWVRLPPVLLDDGPVD